MGRWIVLLPLCLFLRDQSPLPARSVPPLEPPVVIDAPAGGKPATPRAAHAAVLAAWADHPYARLTEISQLNLTPPASVVASLVALGPSPLGPGSLTLTLDEIVAAEHERWEHMRRTDPLSFLQECLKRYEAEVHGYTANFRKKERLGGKEQEPEETDVCFREEPFSVYMNWLQGARLTAAKKLVYVAGANDNKLLALPSLSFLPIQTRDIHGSDAKANSRYMIDQFGMHKGTQRSVASMLNAKARGQLHLKYLGEARDPRLRGVPCYVFHRTPYEPLEEEGVNDLLIFIDKENWLQVGSVLKDPKGKLIAEYFFRDVRINPEFPDWQFTRAVLEKK